MSLLDLISNLDSATKTKLLGVKTTRILRSTFTSNDTDVLDNSIVNDACAILHGSDLIYKKNLRNTLLESVKIRTLKNLGWKDHDEAITEYSANLEKLASDFDIERKYLIKKLGDDRPEYEISLPEYGECNGTSAFPHQYQKKIKRKLIHDFFSKQNPNILVTMPTGSGKTVLAMETIVDLFRSFESYNNANMHIMWLVSSKELCEQSFQSFQKIWKQKGDHEVIAERYFSRFQNLLQTSKSKITFASLDLMVKRLDREEVEKQFENTSLLIIDETHGINASEYNRVLLRYKELNLNYRIMGLTATPFRNDDNDNNSIRGIFESLYQITNDEGNDVPSPMKYLMKEEYLSNVKFELIHADESHLESSQYFRELHGSVIDTCSVILNKKQNTIIFAESKSHAIALSISLTRKGIKNGLIIGNTPDPVRKELLSDFGNKERELSILVNHQILATGIDVPGMNSIIILSDVKSSSMALQILGRALRGVKNGGNKENVIYLTKHNYTNFTEWDLLEDMMLNQGYE